MKKLKETAQRALDMLRKRGADLAIVTAGEAVVNEFNIAGEEFTLLRTLNTNSIGLTAICGGKKGSASINSLEDYAIEEAVNNCISVAMSGAADPNWNLCPDANTGDYSDGVYEPDMEKFFARSKELLETIKKEYPLISITEIILDHKGGKSVYLNSNGAVFTSRSGSYSVFIEFSGVRDEKSSSFFCSGYSTLDLDRPFIDQCTVRADLENAVRSIDTTPVSGKFTGTVVLEPGCAYEFINSVIGSFTGEKPMIDGTSIWKDKLDQQVAVPQLTIRMAPHDDRILGGQRWTSEGFTAEDYCFIENGVLKDFNLSLYGANKTGQKRSANTSGAMVVDPGEKTLEEIIKGIREGLYVTRFSGGDPSSNGDFSGVAKGAFLIRDGKRAEAVSETMISGNLAELLMHITDISKEQVCDGGIVMPWIAADGILISGK